MPHTKSFGKLAGAFRPRLGAQDRHALHAHPARCGLIEELREALVVAVGHTDGADASGLQRFEDGIDAARRLLERCWVDGEKCAKGLEALRHYKKSFNQRLQEYGSTHVHDWAEHGASAFRYLAISHKLPREKRERRYTEPLPSGPYSWAS